MQNQVMLDLETLGTEVGSIITTIGAVKFNNKEIVDSFYTKICIEDSENAGFKTSASTFLFWMNQEDAARKEIIDCTHKKGAKIISDALFSFSTWMGEDLPVWGNGVLFDNALLSEYYKVKGFKKPWSYRSDRCYRTVKNMFPQIEAEPFQGVKHNSLDDASAQANHLIKILNMVSPPRTTAQKNG
jgi:hypothetical protein